MDEVLLNPRANALFGVVMAPEVKDGPRLLVPLAGIRSIGKDAITVESDAATESFDANVRAVEISKAGGFRSSMNVMTESGESIGTVDKVTIKEDGTVASYHSTTGFFGSKHDIEPSEVKAGSEDILIISDGAREGGAKPIQTATGN